MFPLLLTVSGCWLAACLDSIYTNIKTNFLSGVVSPLDQLLYDLFMLIMTSIWALYMYKLLGEPVDERLQEDEKVLRHLADEGRHQ